ncbi:vasoactive intestinal polypeptide receptor-like isoform X2 [Acanthaster planci]|uniref:Vasoactive intestinal polypeptide receptor-like isoform X2 n=1 Tax=Acanthaster planci TaxID=133434 RepID=A0A8B7YYD3_ACAPL|nr:vasoactive intestinal polypeptide receptor-like isoform X2 [Acanthaster planci]
MKLLVYVFALLMALKLAACKLPRGDNATNTSSSTAPVDEELATAWHCIDDGSDGNQSGCSNVTNECGVCKPKPVWICVDGVVVQLTMEDDVVLQVQKVVIYVGFSLSLLACIVANVVYVITRRGLKGSPYHVHWNLIASFTIYHVVFLIDYSVLPLCYVTNVHARNVLHVMIAYTVLANFFWMLVEGLILFGIVVISFFQEQKGRQFIKWCLLGWGAPAVLVIIWIAVESLTLPEDCRVLELDITKPDTPAIVCVIVPVFVILLINLIVLIVVILNINKKLRACDSRDQRKRHRRTAKSTLFLLILLGSYYALPILVVWIGRPCLLIFIVIYVANIISSLQGLAVSTLYVFCNGEVRRLLGKRFKRSDWSLKSTTGTSRLSSSTSFGKRNSSSTSSDISGRQARRNTGPLAAKASVEMSTMSAASPPSRADVNSNKQPGLAGNLEDERILLEVGGEGRAEQDRKKGARSGSGYIKLNTTEPNE